MPAVIIRYNPYMPRTSIIVDGTALINSSGRLIDYVQTRNIRQWAVPTREGRYQDWLGIFLELVRFTNDDALHITFQGRAEDYALFTAALEDAEERIIDDGWEKNWSVSYNQDFEAGELVEKFTRLCCLIREACVTQKSIFEIARIKELIGNEDHLTERIKTLLDELRKFLRFQLKLAECLPEEYEASPPKTWNDFLDLVDKIERWE